MKNSYFVVGNMLFYQFQGFPTLPGTSNKYKYVANSQNSNKLVKNRLFFYIKIFLEFLRY